jgi:hypothetical protein
LQLSEDEERMLIQFFLHDDKTLKFEKIEMRNIVLVVRWPISYAESISPNIVLLRFANGLTITKDSTLTIVHPKSTEMAQIIRAFEATRVASGDLINAYISHRGYEPQRIVDQPEFIERFIAGETLDSFFLEGEHCLRIPYSWDRFVVQYNPYTPAKYQKDAFEYSRQQKQAGTTISIWLYFRYLLKNSITFVSEKRPAYTELASKLVQYKVSSEKENVYSEVKNRFSELFGGVKVEAFEDETANPKKSFIQVSEASGKYDLLDGASGYFEALYILTAIATDITRVIILDEPALHLHPLKIKKLGRILGKGIFGGQVIVVTHSAHFVNSGLFRPNRNLIMVQKKEGKSEVINKPPDFKLTLKPHHLNPELFFCSAALLVEGSSDESAVQAISDALDDVLGRYDIAIINAGNVQNMIPYSLLVSTFKIPHILMLDGKGTLQSTLDSLGKDTTIDSLIIDGDLESDLAKVAPIPKAKLDSIIAYDFVSELMKEKPVELRNQTQIAQAFSNVLAKAGVKPDEIWREETLGLSERV